MSWSRIGHIAVASSVEVHLPWNTLTASSHNPVFIPATAWNLLASYYLIRAWGERTASSGLIKIAPAIQLATDPQQPHQALEAVHYWDVDGVYSAPNWDKAGVDAPTPGWRKLSEPGDTTLYVRGGWLVCLPTKAPHEHVSATAVIEMSTP
jgi:hypothetical protein